MIYQYILAVVLLAGAGWEGYSWSYDRGVASQVPVVAKVVGERDEAKSLLKMARDNAIAQNEAYAKASATLVQDNAMVLAGVSKKLDASQARERLLKEKQNVVYVTPKADAACTVTLGFVRLHNLPLTSAPLTSETYALSKGGPENADTPAGITLSSVGRTVASNYTECEARREVIESWQDWYNGSLAAWLKAVQ